MELVGESADRWMADHLEQSRGTCNLIRAAVAYVRAGHPLFEHCRANARRLKLYARLDAGELTDLPLLRRFHEDETSMVSCKLIVGLHAKVVWWHGYGAYVGSANLTQAAWSKNIECGVFYRDDELAEGGLATDLHRLFDRLEDLGIPLSPRLLAGLAPTAAENASRTSTVDLELQARALARRASCDRTFWLYRHQPSPAELATAIWERQRRNPAPTDTALAEELGCQQSYVSKLSRIMKNLDSTVTDRWLAASPQGALGVPEMDELARRVKSEDPTEQVREYEALEQNKASRE